MKWNGTGQTLEGNIRVAYVGLENQTEGDRDVTLRMIGYDGAEYRAQLLAGNVTKTRYPVVTFYITCHQPDGW